MYRNDKVIRRYSEPFKLKILAELSIGKHNRKDSMNTRVKVETKDEISRIKALQKRLNSLKSYYLKRTWMLWYKILI
jgi:hypothetical protein